MKKKICLLLVFIFTIFTIAFIANSNNVVAATGYYSSISDTATGTTLKNSLRTLITNTHTKMQAVQK